MDDWAQEGWSSSLVVAQRHPATERFLVAAMSEHPAASVGGWTANSVGATVTEHELPSRSPGQGKGE